MFLTTLSFLLSTPGWEPSLGGFPSLSALPGQFLLKDVVLLGAAIWSFGEAWTSSARIHRKRNACHESGSGSQDREILTDREEDASIY